MDNFDTVLNRLKPKEGELSLRNAIFFGILFLLIIAIMIIMPYVVSGNLVGSHVSSESLHVKQLAPEDLYVKRTFEYVDTKATQENKDIALKKVFPIFTYDITKTFEITNRLVEFNVNIDDNDLPGLLTHLVSLSKSEKEVFSKLYEKLNDNERQLLGTWTLEISKEIIKSGFFNQSELKLVESDNINKITLKGFLNDSYSIEKIENSKVLTLDSLISKSNLEVIINTYLEDDLYLETLPARILDLSIRGLLEPNVNYDSLLTESAKDNAIKGVSDVLVLVKAGEKVLSQDSIISEQDIELLKQVESHSAIFSNIQIIARIILILLISIFCIYWFWTRNEETFRRVQFTYIYLLVMVFTLLLSVIITYYSSKFDFTVLAPCLPVLLGTFLLRNTTGKKRFGFVFTIQYALYATLFPGSTFFTFFYLSAIGISFLYIIQYYQDRLARIASIIESGFIAILMTIILYAIQGYPFDDLFRSIAFIVLNIFACFSIERIFLPIIDNSLNIPTIFRLEELRSTDQKLLSKLKMNAQGTFNHSLNVSDLAYEAAKAIGANADLCRVAALYHDVGKSEHPEYFTENQEDGFNKHDELTPSMSGSIIRSHVKLGVDLCKDAGLPQEIIDIIAEHHGNDLIQYFYNEAIKDNDKPFNKVAASDYCYNGNPPQSRESAIIMIADSVEAASHSQKTSPQKVGRLIANIVRQKFDHGQLNDSHLDLTELKQIEKSLEQSLVGKLHTRIKYTNEEDKPNIKE